MSESTRPSGQRCGSALPVASPGDLCPACVMGEAVAGFDSTLGEAGTTLDLESLHPDFDPLEGTTLGPGGRYKILQSIGEGGFGNVYMAEQSKPVRRRVAIKILKAGMDTRQVVARFEVERQALAMMDHPNIAKILDGGETEKGRPFFVMELVRGTPITTFCDREKLPPVERLNLFIKVCRAVQHAHQKGIIHRDLKPSNILVTVEDGTEPVPKVIDFGVAKAMENNLTDKTLFTRFEQMIGTPAYMSPEQAGTDSAFIDIDTRADIYALGVLLYELLTGTTPIDSDTLQSAAFDEVRRILREDEAQRPSARLSSLNLDRRSTIAKERGTEAAGLGKQLRGDLDWIVMCAIEKDRRRRYETANALAKDIERHLNDEPVAAGPPTAAYRTEKFIQRHRRAVATMATVALILVASTAISIRSSSRASKAEKIAQTRLAEVEREKNEKEIARKEAQVQKNEAQAQRDEALWNQYVARQFPIVDAWQQKEFGHLEEMLEKLKPKKGQPDFRGWEWTYFKDQCDQAFTTIEGKCPTWHPQQPALTLLTVRDQPQSTIELRSPEDGSLLRTLAEIPSSDAVSMRVLRWSRDGARLAYLTNQHVVVVLDAESGKAIFRVEVPTPKTTRKTGEVATMNLSHDGRTLATGNWFGLIQLWDVASGQRLRILHDPEQDSNLDSIRFSPNSDQLAASLRFGERKTWNIETEGVCDYTRQSVKSGMVAWNRSGTKFASTEGNHIAVFELNLPDPIASLPHREVAEVAWIGDDQIVSSGGDQFVRIWDAQSLVELANYQLDRSPTYGLSISKDGEWLAVRTSEGIKLVDLRKKRCRAIVLAPNTLHTGELGYVDWGREGRYLASGHQQVLAPNEYKTQLSIWDLPTETITNEQSIGIIRSMGWDSDQSGLLATTIRGEFLRLPVNSGQIETLGKFSDNTLNSISAFSPDGRWLAFGDRGMISLIDATTTERMVSRKLRSSWLWRVCWSNDSRFVATGEWDVLRVWDLFSGHDLAFHKVKKEISCICWSPEDHLLAIGRSDGRIQVFQADSLEEIALISGHSAEVRGVDWSPHGRIASVGGDGTLRIRDASTGDELLTFHHPSRLPYLSVSWSPDGRRLAAGDSEGRIFIWGSTGITPLPPGIQGLASGVIAVKAAGK